MARWKLVAPHYLNTEGVEWQYSEIDRKTMRQVRRSFPVPLLLDPKDPGDWNHSWGGQGNEDGEIIVCHKGMGEDRDIVFFGDPSPDMIPLDDEAKAISAKFAKRWEFSPETASPDSFSQSLVDKFQSQMVEVQAKPVEIPGLSDLVAAMTAQQAQMSELLKSVVPRRA